MRAMPARRCLGRGGRPGVAALGIGRHAAGGRLVGELGQPEGRRLPPLRSASHTGRATPCSRPTCSRTASTSRLTHGMRSASAPAGRRGAAPARSTDTVVWVRASSTTGAAPGGQAASRTDRGSRDRAGRNRACCPFISLRLVVLRLVPRLLPEIFPARSPTGFPRHPSGVLPRRLRGTACVRLRPGMVRPASGRRACAARRRSGGSGDPGRRRGSQPA